MEKEIKIQVPDGLKAVRAEVSGGTVTVTLKPTASAAAQPEPDVHPVPETWAGFCATHSVRRSECWIGSTSVVESCGAECRRREDRDRNLMPDRETAEAVLALCQLIQLRDCYNQGWRPDWSDYAEEKHIIGFVDGEPDAYMRSAVNSSPLYFRTAELRDAFLRNFRPLIDRLGPLYGAR